MEVALAMERKLEAISRISKTSLELLSTPTLMLLGCSCLVGCADAAIRDLEESESVAVRYEAAQRLGQYAGDEPATRALIKALADPRGAGRYAAATAIERHLQGACRVELRNRALLGLVSLLDDCDISFVCLPILGPLLPGMLCRTPSVRSRALLTLTAVMGEDHGFEKAAWTAVIDQRLGGAK